MEGKFFKSSGNSHGVTRKRGRDIGFVGRWSPTWVQPDFIGIENEDTVIAEWVFWEPPGGSIVVGHVQPLENWCFVLSWVSFHGGISGDGQPTL